MHGDALQSVLRFKPAPGNRRANALAAFPESPCKLLLNSATDRLRGVNGKNPPRRTACQSGFSVPTALATFIKRPQAESQIGAFTTGGIIAPAIPASRGCRHISHDTQCNVAFMHKQVWHPGAERTNLLVKSVGSAHEPRVLVSVNTGKVAVSIFSLRRIAFDDLWCCPALRNSAGATNGLRGLIRCFMYHSFPLMIDIGDPIFRRPI